VAVKRQLRVLLFECLRGVVFHAVVELAVQRLGKVFKIV